MAVSGFALFLFVVAHLLGNLQIFLGPEQINRYGHFLQSTPELLWPARIGLLVLVLVHIFSAIKLSQENKSARPVAYQEQRIVAASYASRTMLMSGLIVLAFIIYHLLHFTAQVQYINLTGQSFVDYMDPQKRHDVFRMMVVGFRQPIVSVFYVIGVGLLSLHLIHGVGSMFQSMGWKDKYYGAFLDKSARVISWLIFLGYISIPLAVLSGVVGREVPRP